MVTVTQVQVLLDLIVLLVPAGIGAVAGRMQEPTGERPGEKLVQAGYAAAVALILLAGLHVLALAELLPRVPMAALYLPYGFVLGYFVYRVLIDGQRPRRTESVVLGGISIAATVLIPLWVLARTVGPMLL